MRIATYNVNGIKARIERLVDWLGRARPDVVCLQELKSEDAGVPRGPIEDLGYHLETHGQKGFNGVAILSRLPLSDVVRGLPGDPGDEQARWIEATVEGPRVVRLACLYAPNGNPAPGPKYDYKLGWMARMKARAADLLRSEMPVVLAGDYNVIPADIDAARPAAWVADALALAPSRAALRRIAHLGYGDALRLRHSGPGLYTFWDYQAGAFARNDGIRIDHLMLSPQAADLLVDAGVDAAERAAERPSDHVPVWIDLGG
ncbi:MAG: Exodeoxyribonuclease [Pseudomonadota bacterium]|jgi:exodeoxyribonuclease-3